MVTHARAISVIGNSNTHYYNTIPFHNSVMIVQPKPCLVAFKPVQAKETHVFRLPLMIGQKINGSDFKTVPGSGRKNITASSQSAVSRRS